MMLLSTAIAERNILNRNVPSSREYRRPNYKCNQNEFRHAQEIFLGYVVGQGIVIPIIIKVKAIANFSVPTNKKK